MTDKQPDPPLWAKIAGTVVALTALSPFIAIVSHAPASEVETWERLS